MLLLCGRSGLVLSVGRSTHVEIAHLIVGARFFPLDHVVLGHELPDIRGPDARSRMVARHFERYEFSKW